METIAIASTDHRIVYHSNKTEVTPDNKKQKRAIDLYAGPEGISEVPDEKLGRFSSFLTDRMYDWENVTLYDKNNRRFFQIDFLHKIVIKGHQLSKDDIHKPFQIGLLGKNSFITFLNFNPPLISTPKTKAEESSKMTSQDMDSLHAIIYFMNKYQLVLDETNRIYLLDKESLEFTGTVGYLPVPDTLFKSKRQPDAKDLLSYNVKPVFFGQDKEYKGLLAASLNREGTAIALSVFDPNGQQINANQSGINKLDNSWAKAIYFGIPWGPTLTICKYLLENLQAPIFSLVSYFTADSFEAGSGHRALFILSNSFAAMKGRNSEEYFVGRFFGMILLIFPSLILSVILAGQVGKDANKMGLTHNERKTWQAAMVCFGLAAYITYRLTKPKITLVTCQNCGQLRRPDMDLCHNCKSPWHVPELTPPLWKVKEVPKMPKVISD